PLGRNEKLFAIIAYLLIVGAAFGLTRFLSGRAAYIHMGALFGTIMAANVWMRILPAQRKMIEAIKAGNKPDEKLAAQAKLRSKQNTFIVVPVVFLMISNHFGGSVTGGYDWIHMIILIPVGWLAAKFIRRAYGAGSPTVRKGKVQHRVLGCEATLAYARASDTAATFPASQLSQTLPSSPASLIDATAAPAAYPSASHSI